MRPLLLTCVVIALVGGLSGCGKSSSPQKAATEARYTDFRRTGTAESKAEYFSDASKGLANGSRGEPISSPPAEVAATTAFEPARPEPPESATPKSIDEKDARFRQKPVETPELEQRRQIQAGTLTAGSLNDHENLQDFRDYLSIAQQSPAGRHWPPFSLGERVIIEVQDAQGQGVPDAQVTVTQIAGVADQNEGVLLDTWTRADGRTFFSTGLDAGQSDAQTFELTVRPRGGKPIVQQISLAQPPWVVKLPDVTRQLPHQLDLALVIDTTGSMGDELNYLKVEIDHIAATIHRLFPNVDQRYSLIVYRDEHDEYLFRRFDFTNSLADFRAQLSQQGAKGGGDTPEAMHLAVEKAAELSWRHENTARVMFLVADAPPHNHHANRTVQAVNDLRRQGIAVYPLAGSGAEQECEFLLRATAFLTRGQYLFLTDHSGVGNPHAKPQAPKYEVEPLNQLMIRMIASELSGKKVLAQEILATEENDGSPPAVLPQEQNQNNPGQTQFLPPQDFQHSQHVHPGITHHVRRESLWSSGVFRCVVALVLIAGILFVDHRLRA